MNRKFLDEARDEFDAAVAWYADRDPSLGVRLIDDIEDCVRRIQADPLRFVRVGNRRSCSAKLFPYQVVYEVVDEVVVIVAVAHTSRRPGYWKRRR